MKKKFEGVSARSLASAVPTDLSALCFHRRRSAGQTIRLYAVGDIGLSGRVRSHAEKEGYAALLSEVSPLLRTGDIVFGNLETPLTIHEVHGSLFAGAPAGAATLAHAGFTMLHLANNHIYDYGLDGLVSTLAALKEHNIVPLGIGDNCILARRPVRTDMGGVRIGWLGCGRTRQVQANNGPCLWEFEESELIDAIHQVRNTVDVLLVSIHIGYMYVDYPHPDHKAMAERLAAEGADIILMHHAHVLQGVQLTTGGSVVCYSLGNFLFDWQEGFVKANVMTTEQNEGTVLLFDLDRKGICLAASLPTIIDGNCYVRWAVGDYGLRNCERLKRISQHLEDDYSAIFWQQRYERNTELTIKVLWFHLRHHNWSILLNMLKKVRIEHLGMLWGWVVTFFRVPMMKRIQSLFSRFM